MSPKHLLPVCPYCQVNLRSVVMGCPACETEIRGSFAQSLFNQLGAHDLEFLEKYLSAGFSIKAMEARTGMGYTAIRNRLDRLIDNYRRLTGVEDSRKKILHRLESGEIAATEASELMARL